MRPPLRDVIRNVLDVNYGPMSHNHEVTDSILRAIEADATFVPLVTVERWVAEPCRWRFADKHHCLAHDSYWSEDNERCLAVQGHGYTCDQCPWGRDKVRTRAEYEAHVAGEHAR